VVVVIVGVVIVGIGVEFVEVVGVVEVVDVNDVVVVVDEDTAIGGLQPSLIRSNSCFRCRVAPAIRY
jgi:hypothetical protein